MDASWDNGMKTGKTAGGFQMNHSIYSADKTTHLKIVTVALIAGIAVAGLGISARGGSDGGYAQNTRVIKADKPVMMTRSEISQVR
jgi:hypothetical protein